jgi:exonuclease V gamma subunit
VESLIARHPLHAFNSRYNKAENPLLVNFDLSNNQDLVETLNTEKTEKDIPPLPERKGKKVIQLRDLINFMEDPVKHYFTKTLGVYMSDHTIELAETESFTLDALQGWMVKDELVKAGLHGIQVDEKTLKMKGNLPLSKVGTKTLKKLEEEVQPILENEHFLKFIGEEPAGRSIELELENYYLQGKVSSVYNDTLLFVTPSSSKTKYQVRALMNYFAGLCQGDVIDLLYLAKGGETRLVNSENQDVTAIKNAINWWCEKYEEGTHELICFECGAYGGQNNIDDIINLNEVEKPERLHFLVNSWINSGYNHSITSDYFKYMMQNGGLLTKEKANAFIEMYNAIQRFTQPLN